MLSSVQQREIRSELLKDLSADNKYDEAGLRLQFKQALLAVARGAGMPDAEVAFIVASSGEKVFHDYAVCGVGQGHGLFALIRVYGALRGPEAATALRDRMQQLAEDSTMGGAS